MLGADLAAAFATGSAMGSWLGDKFNITSKSREVGHGAFGAVLQAVCPASGRQLAVKIQMARPIDAKALRDEQKCLALLTGAPHPNVVELLDHFLDEQGGYAALVMPAGMCDLRKLQRMANDELSVDLTVSLSRDLCRGLRHIHGLNILHRDIKPANCLVFIGSASTTLKLSDFGNSRIRSQRGATTPGHCTAWYRPPELFEALVLPNRAAAAYGPSVDMWSCGCVIGEMIIGIILFDGDNEPETIGAMAERLGQPGQADLQPGVAAKMRAIRTASRRAPRPRLADMVLPIGRKPLAAGLDLVRGCLEWHPARRSTAPECMQHALFCDSNVAAAANVSGGGESAQPDGATGEQPAAAAVSSSAAEPRPETPAVPASVTSPRPDEANNGGRSGRSANTRMPRGNFATQMAGRTADSASCRCQGYCATYHAAGGCVRERLPGSEVCHICVCGCLDVGTESSGSCRVSGGDVSDRRCLRARSRSLYCYRHLYLGMPRELQVVRHLGQEGLLEQMMEQLLASRTNFGKDLVLQLIAAWLKEPAAIKALVKFKPAGNNYTATELMKTLHNVLRPEVS